MSLVKPVMGIHSEQRTSNPTSLEEVLPPVPPTHSDSRISVVSFREPPPRPPRSSRRPLPRSTAPSLNLDSYSSAPSTPKKCEMKDRSCSSPSTETCTHETCGYCSDHGEILKSRQSPKALKKRTDPLSSARFETLDEQEEDVKGDDNDILCLVCDNGSYMPPDDPELLLQVAQVLERKARRDLFKAELLRWRIETQQLDPSIQLPLPEALSQKAHKLDIEINTLNNLAIPKTPGSSTLASPISFETSTLPTPSASVPSTLACITSLTSVSNSFSKFRSAFSASSPPTLLTSNDYQQPRSPRTLKKRRPEFAGAGWPESRRQNSMSTLAPLSKSTQMDGELHDAQTPERPPLRSFFSTRSRDQIIPFLRRSSSMVSRIAKT